jgi:hypothetical protein
MRDFLRRFAFASGPLVGILAVLFFGVTPAPGPTPASFTPGWVRDPESVAAALDVLEQHQGFAPVWDELKKGDKDAVFFWEVEEKVLGKRLPVWNQGSVGSCVSFGWGRAVQDLMLVQVAAGGDVWPGAEVATEPIYGGSRVEVGGGGLNGDGSIGAWAAQYVQQYGILLQKVYGRHDLTSYSERRARQWGESGVPDELEPIAKQHPVRGVARITNAKQAWEAIGGGYPIPVCSDIGFDSPLKEGFCVRRGSWAHCMTLRGRFIHPLKGRCFVVQNSWGDYLKGGDNTLRVEGRCETVRLPPGCFAITERDADLILRQGDSFAVSGFKGFPRRSMSDILSRYNP